MFGVTKVHNFGAIVRIQHNIFQLQIAVENSMLVHVGHTLAQLASVRTIP